jgi:hypothetical protein
METPLFELLLRLWAKIGLVRRRHRNSFVRAAQPFVNALDPTI